MPVSPWTPFGPALSPRGWVSQSLSLYLYRPSPAATRGYAWAVWKGGGETALVAHGHTRADLRAYCKRERITLPELPAEWCPDEEPAKPYSLADDPRLREVVRTKWGEARWEYDPGWGGIRLRMVGSSNRNAIAASVNADFVWSVWAENPHSAPSPDVYLSGQYEPAESRAATNPASAIDEVLAALRDLGSLVDEEPDADGWIPWGGGECPVPAECEVEYRMRTGGGILTRAGTLRWGHSGGSGDITAYRIVSSPEPTERPEVDTGVVQPPTLRDRLLNLADRMFYSDHSATFYAGELRDLARELDGGDQ